MEENEEKESKTNNENTLFVGGISWKATEDDLMKCFSKYGQVVEVKIVTDKFNNNQSKGFGFVEFKEKSSYEKVKKLGFVQLFGKNVFLFFFSFLHR
jgi:RNA recognition motif-containing protein